MKSMVGVFVLQLVVILIAPLHAAVVTDYTLYSTNIGATMDVSMMVPNEYADSTHKSYPVLYCLHGSGAAYNTYTSMNSLKNAIDYKYPMIVVTYGAGYSNYAGAHQPWFFDELVPYIESHYRVLADSTQRAVTGFSMGGTGSYLFMTLRPTFFSSVISLSGVFTDNIYSDMEVMLQNNTPFPGLFVDCGSKDAYLSYSQEMHTFLSTRGLDHIYGETPDADHNWDYWEGMADSCAAVAWRYFDTVVPNPVTVLQGVPTENAVTLTWMAPVPASDGDGAKMYAIYRDGSPYDTVFISTFIDVDLPANTSYTYMVYSVDDAYHQSATAPSVMVHTTVDTDAPVVRTLISWGLDAIRLDFDEDISKTSAELASNYALSSGLSVTVAQQVSARTVVLTTSFQQDGVSYTLSVDGVTDLSPAGNSIGTAQQIHFTARASFYDDFEHGLTSAWGPSTTGWSVIADGGSSVLHMDVGAGIVRLDHTYDTFTLDARVRAEDASMYRHVKIVFGYEDDANFYDVDFCGVAHASYNGVMQTVAGVQNKIGTLDGAATLLDPAVYYHIRVEVDGVTQMVRAFCGDTSIPIFEASLPEYTGGKIGLWSHRGLQASFDDIVVSQYIRTGDWAGITDDVVVPLGSLEGLNNPTSLQQLQRAGFQVYTLQGTVPRAGYRGIVVVKNKDNHVVGSVVLIP